MALQSEEDQLLLDQVFVQQFLVEGADGALERIGHAKIFGGDQLGRRTKRHLQNASANIDLNQVGNVVAKRIFIVVGRVQLDLFVLEQAIHGIHEIGADRIEIGRRRAAQVRDFGSAREREVVLGL